jgi:pyruvate/2-oxoglutarate/acetoin dehydrogenase E1 component
LSAYKDALTAAMTAFALDPKARIIGYGTAQPSRGGGTFAGVPVEQCIETPVAENLMVGLGIGLALAGLKPLVYIERADFMLNALDAIVNHLAAMRTISRGEFRPTLLLRIVVGNTQKPLFTGPTHTQDFAAALDSMVSFPVVSLRDEQQVTNWYAAAVQGLKDPEVLGMYPHSTALFEYKDLM